VQRNAFFFAEGCGRRPFSRRSESASRGRRHRESGAVAGWNRPTELATPAGEITSPRQVVSEPIGLGPSPRRAQARRGELRTLGREPQGPFQPLTRDNSASSLRKEPMNRARAPLPRESGGRRAAGAGSFDSPVVLVDRFDCRSRRAARGVVRSRAKSSRRRRGLASPHRSEERKSVGSRPRVAKPEARWRARVRDGRESEHRAGNSSREGASGRETQLF
jgi:hypothetical protein